MTAKSTDVKECASFSVLSLAVASPNKSQAEAPLLNYIAVLANRFLVEQVPRARPTTGMSGQKVCTGNTRAADARLGARARNSIAGSRGTP